MKKIIIGLMLMASSLLGADVITTETNKYVFTKSVTANGDGFVGNGAGLTNLGGSVVCTLGITNTTYLPTSTESVIPMGVIIKDTFGGANTNNSRIDLNKTGLWYFASTYIATGTYGSYVNIASYIYIIENSVSKTNYLYDNKYQTTGLAYGPYCSVSGYWMVTATNAYIKVATDPGAATSYRVWNTKLTALYIGP
jgi:hypothetical protein